MLAYIISSQQFGLSKVVGLGNKCDVDDVEVLNYLGQDPETKVICMYIEGVRDGRSFLTTARKVSKKKPDSGKNTSAAETPEKAGEVG